MTTHPDHHEPLNAEERDLAARLGRAGPIDGPSPALDARILAAAHAAAATHKPRRHGRLAWFGVPPAMITGVGVAAAAVLALGLVWQLRPQYGRSAAQAEADASAGEEVIIFAEPSSAPQARKANPPPLQGEIARDSADPPRPAAAADAAAVAQSNAAERAAAERAAAESSKAAETEAELAAQVVDRAAPAPEAVAEAATAAGKLTDSEGFTPEPPAGEPAMAHKSRATYTTAARATAERRERARVAAAAPAAPPPAPATAAADASAGSTTLDRIEVTGSRIGLDIDWSQIPVNDDTRLPAAEWLERVRARRDGEDVDNARASLRLFRREYPRVRIPDDLRSLLATETQR